MKVRKKQQVYYDENLLARATNSERYNCCWAHRCRVAWCLGLEEKPEKELKMSNPPPAQDLLDRVKNPEDVGTDEDLKDDSGGRPALAQFAHDLLVRVEKIEEVHDIFQEHLDTLADRLAMVEATQTF